MSLMALSRKDPKNIGLNRSFVLAWSGPTIIALLFILTRPFFGVNLEYLGDATRVWYHAKQVINGIPIVDVTHHTVRFSILFPACLVQLAGDAWWTYFLPSLIASIISIFLVYRLVRDYCPEIVTFFSTLFLAFFPTYIDGSLRLLPSAFSILYLLTVFFFLLKYNETQLYFWLILASIAFFFAYSAKMPNLFFGFGFGVGLFFMFGFRSALVFSATLLGLYLVEHTAIFLLFDQPMGRLGVIIAKAEGIGLPGSVDAGLLMKFYILFKYKATALPLPFKLSLIVMVISMCHVFFKGDRFQKILVLSAMCFLIFTFLGFKSLTPLRPFHSDRLRYLYVFVPFGVICLAYSISKVFAALRVTGKPLNVFVTLGGIILIGIMIRFQPLHPYIDHIRFYNTISVEIPEVLENGGSVVYPYHSWAPAKRQAIENIDDKFYWWILVNFLPADVLFQPQKLVVQPFKDKYRPLGKQFMIMHLKDKSKVTNTTYHLFHHRYKRQK